MKDLFKPVHETARALVANIARVIVGKEERIELLVAAFLCRGHVLINDVPGVGKTMLARAFAVSLGGQFRRIQCTPDLLPADILGVSLYNPETRQFAFRRGPVFAQVLLVDEINRATPRTQSALLEAMGETQISVEGATLPLPDPFFVLATQNPVEFEGTFPLPEAQMDRFLVSFALGYPDSDEERAVVEGQRLGHPIEKLASVTEISQAAVLRDVVGEVFIEGDLAAYIVRLVRATRNDPRLLLGASPRGSLALTRIVQAWAILQGRDYVIPDDVKNLAPFVLAHRLVLRAEARLKGYTAAKVLEEIVGGQDVPIAE